MLFRSMFPIYKGKGEVAQDEYDFLSVATHEAGHFLGLAHSDLEGTTMYASYETGQTYQRNLALDDVLGVCSVYRPDGERSVLDDKVYAAPECNPTPRGGYSTTCQEKPGIRCDASTNPARPSAGLFCAAGLAGASSELASPAPVVVVRRTIIRSQDGSEVVTSESPVLTGSPREVEPVTESSAS